MMIPAMEPPWVSSSRKIVAALRARWRGIALGIAVGAVLGIGMGLLLPRWYEASVEFAVVPADDPTTPVAVNPFEGASAALPLFAHVLQSRPVLDEVVVKLGLQQAYGKEQPEDARRDLLRHLVVSTDRKTNIVRLAVEDEDPQRAQRLAQVLGELAEARSTAIWAARSGEHRRRLEARRDEVQKALTEAEGAMQQFRERERIVDLPEQVKASVAQATQLERTRIEKKMGLHLLRSYASEDAPEVQRGQLEAKGAQVELQGLGTQKGPLLALPDLPRLESEHARLKRDIEVKAASYELIARQVEQLRVLEARPAGRAEIIDPAAVPRRPSRPSRTMLALFGALLGLLGSLTRIGWPQVRGAWVSPAAGAALVLLLAGCGASTGAEGALAGPPGFLPVPELPAPMGAVYYLAPLGSDDADGTLERPWRTLERAAAQMAPGDTAYLRGGVYQSGKMIELRASGRAGAPLRFAAYPGEVPTLVLVPTEPQTALDTLQVLGAYVVVHRLQISNQHRAGQGVWIGDEAHDVTLSGCVVADVRGTGVLVSGDRNLLLANVVRGCGDGSHGASPGDHGIYVEGEENVLRQNHVYDNWNFGVQLYSGRHDRLGGGNVVQGNYVYHNGHGAAGQDAGVITAGVVIGQGSPLNAVLDNRLCDNARHGIYVVDATPDNRIAGNVTCFNHDGGIQLAEPGPGLALDHNISYNDEHFALAIGRKGPLSDDNVFFSTRGQPMLRWGGADMTLSQFQAASGDDRRSTIEDPQFHQVPADAFDWTAAAAYDFRTPLNQAL